MRKTKWEGQQGVVEEVRDMKLNQHKTLKEIKEYCLSKGIKVADSEIYKLCAPAQPKKPKPSQPKSSKKPVPATDDLMSAVISLDEEIKSFCAQIRKVARREIVKYVARIRKARRTMGEVISREEEERLAAQLDELDIDPKEIQEINFTEAK